MIRTRDLSLRRTLDQESVARREYLAVRPNRTQRLDDRHQVIQGFKWIAAGSRRHVSYTAIGGKRLSDISRYAHLRISSSNASRLKGRKYSRYLVHLQRLPIRRDEGLDVLQVLRAAGIVDEALELHRVPIAQVGPM